MNSVKSCVDLSFLLTMKVLVTPMFCPNLSQLEHVLLLQVAMLDLY